MGIRHRVALRVQSAPNAQGTSEKEIKIRVPGKKQEDERGKKHVPATSRRKQAQEEDKMVK